MKKTVILILAILPIVLLITIGFAGRILDESKKPRVIEVAFVEPYFGTVYPDDYKLEIPMNSKKTTKVELTFDIEDPDNKGDRAVTYKIFNPIDQETNEEIIVCSVDEDGVITTHNIPGKATLRVISHDNNLATDDLEIIVKAQVTGISLPSDTLEMSVYESEDGTIVGEKQKLYPVVHLPEAPQEDKKVKYTSSDPTVVEISSDGTNTLIAKKEGTAIITVSVTTSKGKTFEAKCTVTVVKGVPPLFFDFSSVDWIVKMGSKEAPVYVSTQDVIDLNQFIKFDPEKVDPSQIRFRVMFSGGANVNELEDGILTMTNDKQWKIKAYVGDFNNPTYEVEIDIVFEQNKA